MKKRIVLLFLLGFSSKVYSESWDSIGDKFTNFGNSVAKVGKGVVAGFKAMGGDVPSEYVYTFMAFNGIQSSITVEIDKAKKVMGARFGGGSGTSSTMKPGENTGATFKKIHLYFSIDIPDCSYSEDHYTLAKKNDATVYAYHTFNDPNTGDNTAEKVGVAAMTNSFSGMIYNGSGAASSVTFPWGGNSVTVPVESNSFNALKSTKTNALRPSTLNLGGTSITVGAKGLGSEVTGTDKKATVYPSRYNYEIRSSGAAIETGLAPGNFKQPGSKLVAGTSTVPGAVPISLGAATSWGNSTQQSVVPIPALIRDITPMECNIWNQPGGSTAQSTGPVGLDLPYQPLWFAYTGQAISSSGDLIDFPVGTIAPGKCLSVSLIRPPVSQKMARLYILRLNTTDQNQARSFLNALLKIQLPKYEVKTPAAVLTAQAKDTLLLTKLPDNIGYVSASGLTGIIMGTDIFTSYGLDSVGPYYYSVPPPMFAVNNVMSTFIQSLTNLTTKAQAALWINLQKWVQNYHTDSLTVRNEVETFLIQNGPLSTMVTKKGDSGYLTKTGLAVLSTALYGPTSISRMPIWYSTMTIGSITAPATWADSKDIVKI
jgi:hypothetical protein